VALSNKQLSPSSDGAPLTAYRGAAGRSLRRYLLTLSTSAEAAYRRAILDAVASSAPQSLLDLGCHDGTWTSELAAAAGSRLERIAGVEIVEEAAEEARRRGIEVVQADLNEPLPFEDARFDVVHANQVIEHLVDLDRFVAELRRVLRPGGRAIVCTENLASWHNVAALVLGYMPFSLTNISREGAVGNPFTLAATGPDEFADSWLHTRVLTSIGLAEIFELHGFRAAELFGAGYHPLPPRVARWLAAKDVRHAAFIGIVAERPA
jgi:SAM-dependent methyltransferase